MSKSKYFELFLKYVFWNALVIRVLECSDYVFLYVRSYAGELSFLMGFINMQRQIYSIRKMNISDRGLKNIYILYE